MQIADDCLYYKGDVPCKFHKLDKRKCQCDDYKKISKRILIIKLGAMGDVIRTTPLIEKLKSEYGDCEITWITYFPDLLKDVVEYPINFEEKNIIWLMADEFDIVYNFDKDKEACGLLNLVNSKEKKGFKLKNGKSYPIDEMSKEKWLTGLDDEVCMENKKSYMQEIFDIAGFEFSGEEYVFPKLDGNLEVDLPKNGVIGLNTGCGARWKTRLWSKEKWTKLALKLIKQGYTPILLGGEQEHERNLEIAKESGAKYFGYYPILKFFSLVDKCDLVVTQVTMTMHIAIGLKKKIVLMNNIFNKNEFELYGRGVIVEPKSGCNCSYEGKCEVNCMEDISPETIFNSVINLMKK